MALVGVLLAVVLGHATIGVALAALTIPQWLEIATAVLKLAPVVIDDLKRLHPVFLELHNELAKGHAPERAAVAAHSLMQTLQRNASAAIAVQDNLPH